MGRRKKEPEQVHRDAISAAAERLFLLKGTHAVTMDEIAGAAGYSKATLYVYFKNKEDVVGSIVLKSMKQLHSCLHAALSDNGNAKETYYRICRALAGYQKETPFYFELALGKIDADPEKPDCLPVEQELFDTGEQINRELSQFLLTGMKTGEFRSDLEVLPTVFLFWAALSGLIRMAAGKEEYLINAASMSREEFLEHGFQALYRMVAVEGEQL